MRSTNIQPLIFGLFTTIIIMIGWTQRNEYWLTPEKGIGYWLGIVGGSLMLVLLLYPLRKHWKPMRNWFKIRNWFKMHMLFGVIGPVFILFHSNFHLGSLNSSLALFSMIVVAASGVFGRYFYQKTHKGLYGEQMRYADLKNDFEQSQTEITQSLLTEFRLKTAVNEIEALLDKRKVSLGDSLKGLVKTKQLKTDFKRFSRNKTKQLLGSTGQLQQLVDDVKKINLSLDKLIKMANYAIYARLFSLWHIFHLPLFFMMIIAGVVHVTVVHLY